MTRLLDWATPRIETTASVDWDALFERELPRVFNFFRFRLGDGPEAEDLTSLTFEKAWRAREKYRPDRGTLPTWLFAIARHLAADHFRRPRREVPLEEADCGGPDQVAEDVAVRRLDCQRLAGLLSRLTERERELIALKYGAEATNREIARLTSLSESNVGTILHRVVRSLRETWIAEGGTP